MCFLTKESIKNYLTLSKSLILFSLVPALFFIFPRLQCGGGRMDDQWGREGPYRYIF